MFSPKLVDELAHQRSRELRGAVAAARSHVNGNRAPDHADVTIRFARAVDAGALERLMQLDSHRLSVEGDVLVAETHGEIRAAFSLADGSSVADPFHPTASLTALLALRAKQLRSASGRVRGARTRRRHLVVVHHR